MRLNDRDEMQTSAKVFDLLQGREELTFDESTEQQLAQAQTHIGNAESALDASTRIADDHMRGVSYLLASLANSQIAIAKTLGVFAEIVYSDYFESRPNGGA